MAKTPDSARRHEVRASLSVPELAREGSSLTLQLYRSEQKIGEISIGRGSLRWRGGKHKLWKRIDWTRFADLMDELAYG